MKLFRSAKNTDNSSSHIDSALAHSLPNIPPTLKLACEAVQQAHSDRDQIAAALSQARTTRSADEIAHQEAIARLATVESDGALDSVDGAATASKAVLAARAQFIATRDALSFSQVRVTGLEAKLTIADGRFEDAERSRQAAWDEFVGEQIEAFHQEYRLAAAAFMSTVDRGIAIALALNHGNTYLTLRRTAIPKEASSRNSLIIRSPHAAWRADSGAVALHSALVAIRQEVLGGDVLSEGSELAGESAADAPSQPDLPPHLSPIVSEEILLNEV